MSASDGGFAGDPGWGPALKTYLRGFIPRRRNVASLDGLSVTRVLFLSLVLAAVLILYVLTFIIDSFGSPTGSEAAIVGALAAASLGAAAWSRRRRLDASSPAKLAESYRTNFFLGFALSEAPLLGAFVFAFKSHELWPYVTVLVAFVIAMVMIGPTRANIARRDQELMSGGSTLSLTQTLMEAPPAQGRR